MLYLICCILVGCSVSMIFRYAEGNGHNGNNIMFINYIMSTASAAVMAALDGVWGNLGSVSESQPFSLFSEKNVPNTILLLIIIGVFSGVYYMSSLVFIRHSYFSNGVATTLMFSKSCFIIPTFAALVLWGEFPKGLQLAGALFCVIAIAIMLLRTGDGKKISNLPILILTLLICGMMQVNSKLFTRYCINDYSNMFLTFLYATACLVSLGLILYENGKKGEKLHITPKEWGFGLIAGACNFGSNWLQLRALQVFPAGLVFPCLAAGNLVIGSVLGWLLFKERLSRKQVFALSMTCVGLVLANL